MIIALDGFKKKEVRLGDEARYLNTLILGQKGTGKSDHVLLNMFHQDLQKKDHSLFAFSSKGETSYKLYALSKLMGRRVHIIKPETNTFHINLLAGEEREVLETLCELFGYAFHPGTKTDAFFRDVNKTLFINSIKVVKRLYGEKATLEDFYDLIANIRGSGRKMIMQFYKLSGKDEYERGENRGIGDWFFDEYFNGTSKTFEQCVSLRLRVKQIVDIQQAYGFEPEEEDLPDWKKVVKNNEIVIVDTEYLKYKEYASLMGTYLLLTIQRELLAEETADTFLYLDDFQRFYPVATELLEGSHTRNIGVTILIQDTKQLNEHPLYKNVVMNSVSNIILLERISIEDYHFYKDQMNAELLNRKRSEIVYKIINREGMAESTNGMLFADERLVLHYEKYLDHKKYLTKKKKKKSQGKRKKHHHENTYDISPSSEYPEDTPLISEIVVVEPETPNITKPEPIVDEVPRVSPETSDGFIMVSKAFEQVKREGDGKEYLSPDKLFEDDND